MTFNVFPARAGMSPVIVGAMLGFFSVPRASGDEPPETLTAAANEECSPRERG